MPNESCDFAVSVLASNHRNVAPAITIAQAPHLKAMLVMTGDRKKEACGKLDGFKKQVGEDGLTQIMKCGGDFPKAYQDAKAFCGSGGAGGKGTTTKKPGAGGKVTTTKKPGAGGGSSPLHLCNIAKMQVCLCLSVQIACFCV